MKISVNNIYFSYNSVNVLDNICFTIRDGEFVSILGPNGSGKSTLIKCINRILRVKQGSILLGEKTSIHLVYVNYRPSSVMSHSIQIIKIHLQFMKSWN